jgi:hypothetical protein
VQINESLFAKQIHPMPQFVSRSKDAHQGPHHCAKYHDMKKSIDTQNALHILFSLDPIPDRIERSVVARPPYLHVRSQSALGAFRDATDGFHIHAEFGSEFFKYRQCLLPSRFFARGSQTDYDGAPAPERFCSQLSRPSAVCLLCID